MSLNTGLGYYFTGNLQAASAMADDILGMLAAGAVAPGWWLVSVVKSEGAR